MKKTLGILIALLLALLTLPALADGDVPPANQIAPGNRSFVEWRNGLRSGEFSLLYVSSGITAGNGCVVITATTEANCVADNVDADLTLQQWANNQWNTYFTCSFYAYDLESYTYTRTVNVTPGYYYRLRVYHCGQFDEFHDSAVTTTKSVYVN